MPEGRSPRRLPLFFRMGTAFFLNLSTGYNQNYSHHYVLIIHINQENPKEVNFNDKMGNPLKSNPL
jgi:hypothetical protein